MAANKAPTVINRNKVPFADGFRAYILETKEMIQAGSYQGLSELWTKYRKDKNLDIADPGTHLDEAICRAIKMLRGNSQGFCSIPHTQPPMQQLLDDLAADPRGPQNLRRGRRGQDAYAWKALHLAALDGKMTQAFMTAFTSRFGCGSCKSHWKRVLSKLPPKFSPDEGTFKWTVEAHNVVSRSLKSPKSTLTVEEARNLWNT